MGHVSRWRNNSICSGSGTSPLSNRVNSDTAAWRCSVAMLGLLFLPEVKGRDLLFRLRKSDLSFQGAFLKMFLLECRPCKIDTVKYAPYHFIPSSRQWVAPTILRGIARISAGGIRGLEVILGSF